MKVKDIFEAFIPRDGAIDERDADHEVRIVVHAPGSLGGTPSVGLSARGIQVGFDWDHGKLLLNPEVPLTRLTPEDVAAIHESVKKGQSWHAYQAHKQTREKHSEQVQQLKAEIEQLQAEIKRLVAHGTEPGTVRVTTDWLKTVHRDLDACQKVIWLAGCGPRGYGFDPAYCEGAQARLKEIDEHIAHAQAQEQP